MSETPHTAAERETRSYKCEAPPAVLEDFRRAVTKAGISLEMGFAYLIRPRRLVTDGEPPDRETWVTYLRERFAAGMQQALFGDWGEATEPWSTHVSVAHHEALVEASNAPGLTLRSAGRLLLMSYAGKMDEVLGEAVSPLPAPEVGEAIESNTTA